VQTSQTAILLNLNYCFAIRDLFESKNLEKDQEKRTAYEMERIE